MHAAMQTLKNALGYAKFSNPEVRDAAFELVDQIGNDLETEDYEPGQAVDDAVSSLEDVLNSVDSSSEDTDAAIKNAAANGVEEEEGPA